MKDVRSHITNPCSLSTLIPPILGPSHCTQGAALHHPKSLSLIPLSLPALPSCPADVQGYPALQLHLDFNFLFLAFPSNTDSSIFVLTSRPILGLSHWLFLTLLYQTFPARLDETVSKEKWQSPEENPSSAMCLLTAGSTQNCRTYAHGYLSAYKKTALTEQFTVLV